MLKFKVRQPSYCNLYFDKLYFSIGLICYLSLGDFDFVGPWD